MNEVAERARVVVGVDCTPASIGLLRWADRYAALTDAVLVAVTGWRIEAVGIDAASTVAEVEQRTWQVLAETVKAALPRDRARGVRLQVLDVVPAEALMSESIGADLVVVGPRSASAIQGLLLGSVTEQVISQASCPVAVLHETDCRQTGRVVVGLDGSACARRALDWAITYAKATGSIVEAITAWEWTPHYGVYPYGPEEVTVAKVAQHLLNRELSLLSKQDRAIVHAKLRPGHPAKVLLDASAEADLLVVGNHRAGPAAGRMLGSISQKLARHATIPVVIVHEHDHANHLD
jgi:nucleotide-binding universal stress UspA family protein